MRYMNDETLSRKIWADILAMSTDELHAIAEQRASTPFVQALVDSGLLEDFTELCSESTKRVD